MMKSHQTIVSVGSNIEPEKHLEKAKNILDQEQNLLAEATVMQTEPDGFKDQADFLNSAYLIETTLPYHEFNRYLKSIEKRLGRLKGSIKSGPRCMDLDIIIWDGKIVHNDYIDNKFYVVIPVNELIEKFHLADAWDNFTDDVTRQE